MDGIPLRKLIDGAWYVCTYVVCRSYGCVRTPSVDDIFVLLRWKTSVATLVVLVASVASYVTSFNWCNATRTQHQTDHFEERVSAHRHEVAKMRGIRGGGLHVREWNAFYRPHNIKFLLG